MRGPLFFRKPPNDRCLCRRSVVGPMNLAQVVVFVSVVVHEFVVIGLCAASTSRTTCFRDTDVAESNRSKRPLTPTQHMRSLSVL